MPTYLPGRLSRPIVLLVALAMLFSLFAVTPSPTQAQTTDPAPDYLASFDACPEDERVIPDAGFVDVPNRHANAGDINCIAYYGITKGTTATTYSPDAPVIREHMALFLIRLAKKVDIYVPSAGSTPFTDIAKLSRESREAISQIYQMGITIGATRTTYAPSRNVSRGEMALFLQRLMDLMEVVADGRNLYGYVPDDVNDNDLDADIEAPWRDIELVPHAVNTAVTELYELGVATGFGGSTRTYGTDRDMSRADMAAFMAAILDHSNLRPKGVNIQVSPTRGSDDFDITAMISVRSDSFDPVEDQAVDWFYTADPDGGLERNGECDISEILGSGDCEWQNSDEETNRDGNIFEDVRATAGETMTFYAWIGRRNGDEFDEDNVDHSKATAISEKGPSSLLITHDVPAHAWQVGGTGAYIVDLDRRSSVEFTIQLQDSNGVDLERDGVVVDIDVDSREILVDADDVTNFRPDPDYRSLGRDTRDSRTVVTNRRGEATFELDGPSRDERLDDITIETDCCTERIRIAWSNGDSVLVSAQPSFKLYQYASSNGTKVEFTVQYDLYDQYGNALRGRTTSHTGRQHDVGADIKDNLYTVTLSDNEYSLAPDRDQRLSETWSRGRVRSSLSHQNLDQASRYLIVIKPDICSSSAATDKCDSSNSDRIEYAEDVIVWVVKNATDEKDFSGSGENVKDKSFGSTNRPSGLKEVELYSSDGNFRTFFTLWSYDNSDRFQAGGEDISLQEFEKKWDVIDGVEDIEIPLYTSGLSLFIVK